MSQTRLGYYQGIQRTYPAPFAVVSAAVYDYLSVHFDQLMHAHHQGSGIAAYTLRLPITDTRIRLHVMQTGDQLTTIRIRPYLADGQTIDDMLSDPKEKQIIGALCNALQHIIVNTLRYTYPDR